MAYNLTLQLLIQSPTQSNLNNIRRQIESSLKGLNVDIIDPKNFAKTNAAIQNTSKQLDRGRQSADKFWDVLEGKARGAVAYTVVNTALLKLTSTVSQATREALKYETELLKISQVTGDSVKKTREYSATLVDISKKYNVTLSKVAQLTRTLTQTGLSFREAAKGAEVLARTSLLATFDSLTSTTEGLIAVMQTFSLSVEQAGDVLEKINAVSKQFAVESGDIVEAIRRAGGAFGSAGGQVEELIALFTSVRSTSRESAETIATGFRTIFGRLQRPKTIEYFKQLGIQLETAEGQFVGPLNAIREISEGLERLGISAGSTKFAEIVEQIGGIRQISRVVPLLEEFEKTQKAIDIQNNASAQSTEDLAKAQQGLGFQLGQLNKEFGAFISDVVNSPSFKFLADVFINTSRAVLGLVSSLKPLLPLLATVAAFKIGRGLSSLLSGGFSLKGAKKSLGFASGGMVPGSGNGDTVPAMLTPGEFVIRKSAVQAFGADRLAGINKYATGGIVELTKRKPSIGGYYDADPTSIEDRYKVDPENWSLVKRRIDFRDKAKNIWQQAVQKKDPNAYISNETGGFAGEGSQKLGKKELDKGSGDERRFNKIAGALAELEVQKYLKTATKLTDREGPDFEKNGEFFEVKTTKRKVPEKEIIAKAVLAEGIKKKGSYKDGSIQTVDPKITYIRAMNKGGFVQKFANGGEAEKQQKEFGQILLSEDGKNIEAKYAPNQKRIGFVRTKFWKDNLYTIGLSKATQGYGPKLYDVAMEAITAKGGMLTSDRATVSGDARKVWDFYFNNRSDVKKTPLPRDQWTGNYALVDEKLRGPKETWPPTTDPAWALQTGYSKSPSLINDPSIVKRVKGQQSSAAMALNYFSRFANGGSVNTGTDTVPALLTPGEFVINKRSAQSFGYNNLKNINRYADGGVVHRFKNGGGVLATSGEGTDFISFDDVQASAELLSESLEKNAKANQEAAKTTEETTKKTKVSFLEFAFGMQSAISSLKVFAGIPINQEVFTAANTQAQQYNLVAESLRKFDQDALRNLRRNTADASKSIKSFGSGLAAKGGVRGGVGRAIQGGGNILGKVAVGLAKYGPMIVKGLITIARVFDITAWASLIGGFVDALFSENIKGQKEAAIQAGDVAKAGALAAEQYNQEMLRGIPIIGGFLAPFSESIDATILFGTVVRDAAVATAELQATMAKFDRDFATSQRDFDRALMTGDPAEIQDAMQAQRELLQDARGRADAQASNVLQIRQQREARSSTYSGYAGGLGSMAANFVSQFSGEHKAIVASLEAQADAYEKYYAAEVQRTEKVAQAMTQSGLQIIAAGGSIEDAFAHMQEIFGDDAIADIFGQDIDPSSEGLAAAYEAQKVKAEAAKEALKDAEIDVGSAQADYDAAWPSWIGGSAKVRKEALLAAQSKLREAEGNAELQEQRQNEILAMATQFNRQVALNKERAIEAAAIAKQIELSRQLTQVFDRLNITVAAMSDAENVMNVMSGDQRRYTGQQALDVAGITNAGVSSTSLRLSGQQVLRDQGSFDEVLRGVKRLENAQGQEGVFSGMLSQSRFDMAQVQRLEGLLNPDTINEIRSQALTESNQSLRSEDGSINEQGATTVGNAIREKLITQLGLQPDQISPQLNAALLEYGKLLAAGVSDIEATEQIKDKLGEASAKFIEEFQGKYKEVQEGEIKIREAEIALADRRAEEARKMYELTIKTYDVEREYFEKRFNLARDTEDFLNPVAEAGPNRARQLSIRSQERRGAQMGALNERRRGAGIGEDTGEATLDLEDELDLLNLNAEDASHQLAMLGIKGNELVKTISEEIAIEQEHMESLKEVALAQQAYQQELNDAKGSITKELVFGTDDQRADTLNTLNATAFAASQGSLAGIPEDMRAGVEQTLDKFANVVIPGLGMTGRQAQARIATNELIQMGVDPASAAQRAREMVQAKVPIDEKMAQQIENQEKVLMDLYEKEKAAQDLMIEHEKQMIEQEALQTDIFAQSIVAFREAIDQLRMDLGLIDQDRAGAAGPPVSRRPGTELPPLTPQWGADMESRFGDLPATAPGVNAPPNGGGQRPPNAPNGGADAGVGAGGVSGTGQAGSQPQIPIEINVQGQQDITVRIPDIQALANGVITAMVYSKIEETFGRIAESARSANLQNFEDLIQIFENGSTSQTSSQSSFGGGGG